MLTLDKQFDYIPKEIKFCKNCVVSNQRPFTDFNSEGICSACEWSFEKDTKINWALREQELQDLCNKHRNKNGRFDVIVPGSGGKDSALVAHTLKEKYGMNPLCVTWAPFDWTPIGWKNLSSFSRSGFTNITCQPDGNIYRKLARLSFELLGDAFVPFAYGQKAYAYHIAKMFDVSLIFYGENGSLEYGGSTKYKNRPKEEPSEWALQYYKGAQIDKLIEVGMDRGLFSKKDANNEVLDLFKSLHPDVIDQKGLEMHWFSYYHCWTPQENYYYAAQYTNFEANDKGRSEGTYTKYASLDDVTDGFHFYLSYIKFGLGRASRDAQQDIRRRHISREEGVRLVQKYDGEFPQRHFQWFLDYLGIEESFFWEVMDFYRSVSNVWIKENGTWKLKDIVS